jgi:hypothetical protein
MFQSKALKEWPGQKKSKIYDWWIDTTMSKWYYDFMHKFIENPFFQLKRLCQWYLNVFRYDYDFDGHSLFGIIEYKLKRLEKCLINGHAFQEPIDMKALSLAIKLAGRLKDDKYEEVGYNRIDKIWGEINLNWDAPEGVSLASRPNVKTDEDKEQERAYSMIQYRASEYRMKREERWLYAILHKYLRNLWD